MGVPKFFRYISERYPCLSELAREQCIPDFDNLYLDMNGIIHNCSHPDDSNIHFNITEEEMFKDIFNYIDKLFFLIKPHKLFFMAIDGVAPRAKMNQQRSRRFRSAKEAEMLEKLANSRGEVLEHERFDSNCITPGTEFMDRLHEALRYFIKSKISADPLWQKCRVILSGHNSPGEGEHKIMDYIRYLKSQSDFNPNTRHCLYGLDADLIILGLCTHELHFVVLREEVKFGRNLSAFPALFEQLVLLSNDVIILGMGKHFLPVLVPPAKVLCHRFPSPGEGEHKIMDYIRYLKSQSDFNPNTRHCLYGLDADLIILGLCTHELHFVVLREEVKFGRKTKKASVEETRFFLLHLGLLREYLELEFDELKQQDATFDIAKLIDDWVLMGFLVGNDFIPHLPCLHISSNALPLLYKTYKKVYSTLGGNINENGKLNLPRLEKYFAALAEVEFEIFQENHADLKYFEAKQTKNGIDEAFDFDVSEINNESTDIDLAALIESSRQFLEEDDEDISDNETHISDEFANYKRNYYMNKLNKDNSNSEHAREQAICYITALQWILDYYYRGVQSWDWYYPHHYAPFISDLKDFQDYEIKFNLGKPFLPFQQLLAVLPAASKTLLPAAYRELMTSASSELIHFYPEDFKTDLNGKQHEWEAVVLIPFIDETLLLNAMAACDQNLTAGERKRNQHGPMLQYDRSTESQGQVPGIYSLKALCNVFCTEKPFWSGDILVSPKKTVCVELPNAARHVFFPGFPTMKHLNYTFENKHGRVKVFDYHSRNENMILKPENRKNFDDVYTVAEKLLHQVIYIGWPHLIKAKVMGVSNKEKYIDIDGIKDMDPKIFDLHVRAAQEHLTTRMGIEYPDFSVMVHVRTFIGSSYVCGSHGKVTISEMWSQTTTAYPAQGVVSQISVQSSLTNQHKKIEQLFPENSRIFFVGNPYYGSEGIVMNPMLVYECGRLKVNITVLPEPDFTEAKYLQNQLERDYVNSYQAAAQIGIHVKSLARITGSVLVVKGARRPKSDLPENLSKLNIGLQFKYVKHQEELAGYARRVDNQWFLSTRAIALIQAYMEKFPIVIEYLSKTSDRPELLFEQDLFPDNVGEKKVEEIVAWLKEQEHAKAERIVCGSKTMEKEAVEKVLDAIEQLKCLPVKTVKLQVKPHLLLKPDVSLPDVYKPNRTIKLFDRVVIVKTTYMVPLGSKGTVVGIYPVSDPNPVRLECVKAVDNFYEVLFDKYLPNGNDIHGIANQRVYKVPESSVLLIFTQDNNRPNDNFYDSKMSSSQLEDTRHITSKSWTQSKTANNSLANNSGTIDMQKSNNTHNDVKIMPQVVQKGGDDFWMPAVNTKQKHTNALIENRQNPINVVQNQKETNPTNNGQQPSTTSAASSIQECQDGTQLLKSLLGLSANQTQVIAPQLPKPPTSWRATTTTITSWRADAQKMPVMQSGGGGEGTCSGTHNYPSMPISQPSFNQSNAPLAVIGGTVVSLPSTQQSLSQQYQQQMLQSQLHQGNQKTSQQQAHYQQQNLCMQNDKMYTSNCLNHQKGAFIPLQVARSGSNNDNSNSNIKQTLSTSTNNHNNSLNIDQTVQNMNQLTLDNKNDANTSSQQIDIKPAYGRKKPPRVPKIGAKFDFAQ